MTNQIYLKKVTIYGLHDEKNVVINFLPNATIIMAENGVGKTTILNILFSILSGNLKKLCAYNFVEARLEMSDGQQAFSVKRSDLSESGFERKKNRIPNSMRHLLDKVEENLDTNLSSTLIEMLAEGDLRKIRTLMRDISPESPAIAISNVTRYLMESPEIIQHYIISKELQKFLASFPFKVLYLPTYRRVEENLAKLGIKGIDESEDFDIYDEEFEDLDVRAEETLIHFGMDDVTKRFFEITQKIKNDTMASYSKISGGMLDELLQMPNFSNDHADFKYLQNNEDKLDLVLKRIGSSISDSGRSKILQLVKSGEIANARYQPIAYFLGNLIKIYEEQKVFDQQINRFVDTINEYFNDKKMVYDEVDPKIYVSSKRSKKVIELNTLSSGEKQLISILSLIYLENKKYAVIFDEPELSLSTEWQEKLLPDLMKSGNCEFLLAATHSPYIFANELAECARPMNVTYSKEAARND
ncbi:AAA family ATPase [Duganella sp. S19_KUP01_CR8]|uniref:AAA family ATPase n=1 Tax=Duganella sp. S19_KUP01_CR8 TaxID=3025502 RepID=UPI002FCD9F16